MGIFVPIEVDSTEREKITGMPAINYRDLKRRGFFEAAGTGWNRHPLHSVAGGLVFESLRAAGVPPMTAKPIVARAAMVVLVYAYEQPGAVVDDKGTQFTERPIQLPTDFLRRFLVATAGQIDMYDCPSDAFAGEDNQPVAIVLDLERLGRQLAAKAGGPLVIFERDESDHRIGVTD